MTDIFYSKTVILVIICMVQISLNLFIVELLLSDPYNTYSVPLAFKNKIY